MQKNRVLAVIPARGGSRRVPGKNMRMLNGRPLLGYALEQAKACPIVDKVVVSSDSDEICAYARSNGAEAIKRPSQLAADDSPTLDAVRHVLEELEMASFSPGCVVILQPTSPLRAVSDITACVRLFQEGSGGSIVSVSLSNPFWSLRKEGASVMPVCGWEYLTMRKQDLPKAYSLNGAVFVVSPECIRKGGSIVTEDTRLYEMPAERSLDIDEEADFAFAQFLLGRF